MEYQVEFEPYRAAGGFLINDIPALDEALTVARDIMAKRAQDKTVRVRDEISVLANEGRTTIFRATWAQGKDGHGLWRVFGLMGLSVD